MHSTGLQVWPGRRMGISQSTSLAHIVVIDTPHLWAIATVDNPCSTYRLRRSASLITSLYEWLALPLAPGFPLRLFDMASFHHRFSTRTPSPPMVKFASHQPIRL